MKKLTSLVFSRNMLNIFLFLSIAGIVATGCKKDKEKGCMDPTATNYNPDAEEDDGSCQYAQTAPSSFTPTFTGSYGLLVAINAKTEVASIPGMPASSITIGTAVANFVDAGGNAQDVGDITADGETLTQASNNAYYYQPGATDVDGIDFGSDVAWTVDGGSGFPSINQTFTGFPQVDPITSAAEITRASGYTLTTNVVSGADSTYFIVYDQQGNLAMESFGGNVTSHTFSAADLNGLVAGFGYTQIVGVNINKDVISGKDIYFINEAVSTEAIDIK